MSQILLSPSHSFSQLSSFLYSLIVFLYVLILASELLTLCGRTGMYSHNKLYGMVARLIGWLQFLPQWLLGLTSVAPRRIPVKLLAASVVQAVSSLCLLLMVTVYIPSLFDPDNIVESLNDIVKVGERVDSLSVFTKNLATGREDVDLSFLIDSGELIASIALTLQANVRRLPPTPSVVANGTVLNTRTYTVDRDGLLGDLEGLLDSSIAAVEYAATRAVTSQPAVRYFSAFYDAVRSIRFIWDEAIPVMKLGVPALFYSTYGGAFVGAMLSCYLTVLGTRSLWKAYFRSYNMLWAHGQTAIRFPLRKANSMRLLSTLIFYHLFGFVILTTLCALTGGFVGLVIGESWLPGENLRNAVVPALVMIVIEMLYIRCVVTPFFRRLLPRLNRRHDGLRQIMMM